MRVGCLVIQISTTIPPICVTGGGIHEDAWMDSFSTECSTVLVAVSHGPAVIIVSAELPSCLGCAQRDGGHDGAVKEDKLDLEHIEKWVM